MTSSGQPTVWGRFHRYRLGTVLADRTFVGTDEDGFQWMVQVGTRESVASRVALAQLAPGGVLPKVREYGELAGGRMGFAVSEFVAGYSVYDVIAEGRVLSAAEVRRLAQDIGQTLRQLDQSGLQLRRLSASDIVFDPARGRWRLALIPDLMPGQTGEQMLPRLAEILWEASGATLEKPLPWEAQDRRLAQLLASARSGRTHLPAWCRSLQPRSLRALLGFGLLALMIGLFVHLG